MFCFVSKLKAYADKKVLVFENKEYTYKQFLEKIKQQRSFIKSIKKAEVVAILGDYSFENLSLFFALYLNKNIIVPITSEIKKVQEEYIKEAFCTKVIDTNTNEIKEIKASESHPLIKKINEKEEAGLVLFSSGSTGKPKAMIHSLDKLLKSYENKKEKSMNFLLFLMFDHIGGLNTVFNTLSMGSTLIIPKTRDAKEICELIEKYKIRILPSSPTFLNLILISGEYLNYSLNSLRMITYGTEAMPQSLLLKLKELFPKVKFLQTFGTSETGISTTSSKSSDSLYMKIEEGDNEYKVVEGELYLRSQTQVLGYLNTSMDSFTDDGWFKTGDLVEQIEDGYFKIIGRSKEVINVGGEKVLPIEVESVVLQMGEVFDCMAYGEKNSITGQSVVVDIVCKDELSSKEAKKLIRTFCKKKLDAYKIPTKVNLVERTNFSTRFKKIRVK